MYLYVADNLVTSQKVSIDHVIDGYYKTGMETRAHDCSSEKLNEAQTDTKEGIQYTVTFITLLELHVEV